MLNTDLCHEEIMAIIQTFLHKRQEFNIDTTLRIQPRQVMNLPLASDTIFPKLINRNPTTMENMKARIANICCKRLNISKIEISNVCNSIFLPYESICYYYREVKLLQSLNLNR